MPEFLTLLDPLTALERLLAAFTPRPQGEVVSTTEALGRVTLEPVLTPEPLPAFNRSTVDGYAVRAADTHGAGETLPAWLQVVGEVPMGAAPDFSLQPGQAALIHTGGMLPDGADAVVMLEHSMACARSAPGDAAAAAGGWVSEIEVLRAVAVGENLLLAGEDLSAGEPALPAGMRLRPAEIGGLMALGLTSLVVARKPRVALLACGDEVVPPDQRPAPGQVRDVNTYTLGALVEEAGGSPLAGGILPDRPADLHSAARRALASADALVISAGSSASTRDLTAEVIAGLGLPGVLVHGVNVRPGKPTILAVCEDKPVIGLPGNPVSALVIAGLFLTPVIEALLGLRRPQPRPCLPARLTLNLASQAGREDWVPVRLLQAGDGWLAEPVFGKSNLIFTLARAHGLVRIPPAATGLPAGAEVLVFLL
jgi:molybdopterin molybdotransferase